MTGATVCDVVADSIDLTQAATTMNQSEATILDQLTDLLGTFTGRAAGTPCAEVSA
jgi:hypothetical protein